MIATLLKLGPGAAIGLAVGIAFAEWIDPRTTEGWMVLVALCTALVAGLWAWLGPKRKD